MRLFISNSSTQPFHQDRCSRETIVIFLNPAAFLPSTTLLPLRLLSLFPPLHPLLLLFPSLGPSHLKSPSFLPLLPKLPCLFLLFSYSLSSCCCFPSSTYSSSLSSLILFVSIPSHFEASSLSCNASHSFLFPFHSFSPSFFPLFQKFLFSSLFLFPVTHVPPFPSSPSRSTPTRLQRHEAQHFEMRSRSSRRSLSAHPPARPNVRSQLICRTRRDLNTKR